MPQREYPEQQPVPCCADSPDCRGTGKAKLVTTSACGGVGATVLRPDRLDRAVLGLTGNSRSTGCTGARGKDSPGSR